MKATVILASHVHEIVLTDVVEHEGQFWLVPEWFENSVLKVRKPTRLIGIAKLRHQRSKTYPEFVVEDPIPKSVFFDEAIPPELENKYEILESPDIRFPIYDS